MLDETVAWRVDGDGTLVTSGQYGGDGPVIHARCADRETAEHIVRLHNDARHERASTARKPAAD